MKGREDEDEVKKRDRDERKWRKKERAKENDMKRFWRKRGQRY